MDIALKDKKGTTSTNIFKTMSLSEAALFFLTLLLWIDRVLLTYIRAFAMSLPIIGRFVDYIIAAVYAVLIVCSAPKILKKMRMADLLFALATVVICALNYIFFPSNAEILDEYLPNFLLLTFPLYFIGLSLDFEKVYPWLYRLSLITIPAFTIYKLFVSAPMTDVQSMYEGDMWSAYNMLPHVCVVAIAALKKPGFINVALTATGVIMISLLGSRGPFICAVLSIVTYLVFFKKYKRPVLSYFAIALVAIIVILGLNDIMQFLYDLAEDAGLSVRIFEKFFSGKLSDSSDRDIIAVELYENMSTFGHGLLSDRLAVGIYAHNLAVELWYSFGIIFGTVILGGIIVILLRAALVTRRIEKSAMLFIPLFFAGFVKLFLSGTILNEIYFFLLIGISMNFIRESKTR